jgi:hypothetical protein
MFNELKEDVQKQLNESQGNMDKKRHKTQKQLNQLKGFQQILKQNEGDYKKRDK